MILALFNRLFKRAPAPRVSQAPAAIPRASKAPAPVSATTERRAMPLLTPVGIGARRPLVSVGGALAGFEFYVGAAMLARLQRREDEAMKRACTANVLGAMRLCCSQGLIALAEMPASWLARCASDDMFAPGMHLMLHADGLFDDPKATEALVARLRGTGVRVGWRPQQRVGDKAPPGPPDFMALAAPARPDAPAWRAAIATTAQSWPGVAQVLLELPDVDLLEAVLEPPVTLAACAVGTSEGSARTQALPPQAARLLRLLNRLVRDDDNALLVSEIKSDAALSLRLLQHLNSAGASPGRELVSIDQAVMVLGRDALYRWVAQMLVRLSPTRPAADALQTFALARARLMELLARAAGEPGAGSLYLLGLASMLPLLLRCSLDDALASLSLPPMATQALRERSGPWHAYLALVMALESHDMGAVESMAQPFGGIDAVLALSAQAWLPN